MPESQLPESPQEKLKNRLFRYARSMVQIKLPHLSVESPEEVEGNTETAEAEENVSADLQLHALDHVRREWKKLRSYVLGDEDKETSMVGPSDVNMEAVSYLESTVETLNRRDEELRKKQSRIRKDKNSWTQSLDDADDGSHDRETLRETISALENRLREIEEMLSIIGFRRSLAEAMLTQIAVADSIQTWEEFHPRRLRENRNSPDQHQKRAILIGLMAKHIRNKDGYTLQYDLSYNSFFNKLNIGKRPLDRSYLAIRNSLAKFGLWETGQHGDEGSHLDEILSNCVGFAEMHDWRPDDLGSFLEEALETVGRRL
jgi:hypothetical protein